MSRSGSLKRLGLGIGCLFVGIGIAGGGELMDWLRSARLPSPSAEPVMRAAIDAWSANPVTPGTPAAPSAAAALPRSPVGTADTSVLAPGGYPPTQIPGFRLNPGAPIPIVPKRFPTQAGVERTRQQEQAEEAALDELRSAVGDRVAASLSPLATPSTTKPDPQRAQQTTDARVKRMATRFRRPAGASTP